MAFKTRRARIKRSREGFLSFGVEIDPAVKNTIENIRRVRQAVIDGVFDLAVNLVPELEETAKENAEWIDHPEEHPSARYPSSLTARDNITANVFRLENSILITLGHSPETIMVTAKGRVITYGGILESEFHGPYAVLQPTMRDFADEFRHLSRGAAVVGYKRRGGSQ